jgi:hypothetical protein
MMTGAISFEGMVSTVKMYSFPSISTVIFSRPIRMNFYFFWIAGPVGFFYTGLHKPCQQKAQAAAAWHEEAIPHEVCPGLRIFNE